MKLGALPRNGLILLMLAIFVVFYQKTRVPRQIQEPLNPTAPDVVESSNKDKEANTENPVPKTGFDEPFDPKVEEWISLIQDNTFEIHAREMPAYWHFLGMAKNDSFDAMNERARKDLVFNDFYLHANDNRGALTSLDLNVRRVTKYPAQSGNAANISDLYEIWGWTNQSQAWVYVFVTPELPTGITEGEHVQFKVRFSGYFFKLQSYLSALGKPGDRPLVAPLLIGRFEPLQIRGDDKKPIDVTRSILLMVIGAVFVVSLLTYFNRPSSRKTRISTNDAHSQGSDEDVHWLEQNLDVAEQAEVSPKPSGSNDAS